MSHTFFASELEGVATFWRIKRKDGVALGFTSHNRDLAFGGMIHRAAPGMVPSAIRRTADLQRDAVEVEGVLAHDTISAEDLEVGRYTSARIAIGLVDWETLDNAVLFNGDLGDVSREDGSFEAELRSAKAALEIDPVPRTSPTCRAAFCDAACALSPALYTHLMQVASTDIEANSVALAGMPANADALHGHLKWIEGPLTGVTMQVIAIEGGSLVLDRPLAPDIPAGTRAYLREGCDHTIATCAGRFANAANFRGEPHLPGNDLLARYPTGTR